MVLGGHSIEGTRRVSEMIGSMIIKRMARSAFEKSWNRGDVYSMMGASADDVVFEGISGLFESISGHDVAVPVKGKKAAAEFYRKYFEEFPKTKFTVKNICIREVFPLLSAFIGTSVIMSDWSATQTHKEGKEFKYDGVTVTHLRRGKIIRMSDYLSPASLPQLSTLMKLTSKA
jgi:ketosteroid isomerase-like protein